MIFSDVVEAIKVSVEEKKLTCYCSSIYGNNVGQKIYDNFKQRKQSIKAVL